MFTIILERCQFFCCNTNIICCADNIRENEWVSVGPHENNKAAHYDQYSDSNLPLISLSTESLTTMPKVVKAEVAATR